MQIKIYVIALVSALSFQRTAAQATTQEAFVKISGEVSKPLRLNEADLAKMEQTSAILKDKDGKSHTYSGVELTQLLTLAGATTGSKLRGENLAKYLLAKCADGYEVLFSLAEFDSSFTDKKIILATRMDDQPIVTGKGPFRLVVPNEKIPARSCFQVVELTVGFAKE